MTQSELVKEASYSTGYTQAVCDEIIREAFNIIFKTLESYDNVKIPGFGTFSVYDRKSRNLYNHKTHEVNYVEGYKYPKFNPSAQLKEAVKK